MSTNQRSTQRRASRAATLLPLAVLVLVGLGRPEAVGAQGCPDAVDLVTDGSNADVDLGFTGFFHDQQLPGWRLRLNVSGCGGSMAGSCGVCALSGPLPNTDAARTNRRCSGDMSIACDGDFECGVSAPCVFFASPPLPIIGGGVGGCIVPELTGGVSGTIAPDAGDVSATIPLQLDLYLGPSVDQPCPICDGGMCDGGPRHGLACEADATTVVGDASYDCPPTTGFLLGAVVDQAVTLAAGTQSLTLSAASPNCRASGFTTLECACDTCDNLAATPCRTNADCTAVGATTCGGLRCLVGAPLVGSPCSTPGSNPGQCGAGGICGRPGEATRPNLCGDGTCTAIGGGEGECQAGPFDGECQIEFFRSCVVASDCPAAGDTCTFNGRECYPDNGLVGGAIVASGTPDPVAPVLAAVLCSPPTGASAANGALGLPGASRMELPTTMDLVAAASGPCPSAATLAVDPATSREDLGWTAIAHDEPVSGWALRFGLASCAGATHPSCGQCTISGLLPSAGGTNRRCVGDTSIPCTVDGDCGGSGPCRFFASPPAPLSVGGVGVCFVNEVSGALTGTVDVEAGALGATLPLTQEIYLSGTLDQPCPTCEAGTCDGGVRHGLACAVHASDPLLGDTSFDCPPSGMPIGAAIDQAIPLSTATGVATVSAATPSCQANGYTTLKCLCNTCDNAAGTPCASNADCTAVGATACGGLRCLVGAPNVGAPCTTPGSNPGQCGAGGFCGVPGEPTKPNSCSDAACTPTGGGEGRCVAGPFDGTCQIETFRSCLADSDCPLGGDTCVYTNRECYTDNGALGGTVTAPGQADAPFGNVASPRLASLFCGGYTGAASANIVAGLPGLVRFDLRTTLTLAEEVASGVVGAGGSVTTDDEADGATAADPVESTVTSPNAGEVTVTETFLAGGAPTGFAFFGRQVVITAPPASVGSPLALVFLIDASVVPPGEDETTVEVFKDGVLVADCTGAPSAIPDPCVSSRTTAGDDLALTILSSSASTWGFGIVTGCNPSDPKECVKCQRTIAKETSKFVKAKVKALQKCEEGKVRDKHGDTCPDAGAPAGSDGKKAADAIAKASSKLGVKIAKACGGDDNLCGTADDTLGVQQNLSFPPTCPNFEGGSCNGVLTHCGDVAACMECIAMDAVDQAMSLYYAGLEDTDPSAQQDLNKCQQVFGKELSKFALAKEKALLKCWDGLLKGKDVGSLTCPDAGAPAGSTAAKTAAKIAKAESKKIAKLCKACGGPGKACENAVGPVAGDGVPDDFTALDIFVSQGPCPAVVVPGGQDCGAIGGGLVDDLEEVIACLDCVTEFKVDCIDAARVPSLTGYPPECNP